MTPKEASSILSNMRAMLRPILGDGELLEKAARVAAQEAFSVRVRAVNHTIEMMRRATPRKEFPEDFGHLLMLAEREDVS